MQRNWRNIFKAQGFEKFPMQYAALFCAEYIRQHNNLRSVQHLKTNFRHDQSCVEVDNTVGLCADKFIKADRGRTEL